MTQFYKIYEDDRRIIGELNDGNEVSLPAQNWEDEDQWREISENLLSQALEERHSAFAGATLSISQSEAVTILRDEGHVEHEDEIREELKAELLLEYLVSNGVFELDESSVVILQDPRDSMTPEAMLHWSVVFDITADRIGSILVELKNRRERLENQFDRGSLDIDYQEELDRLLHDALQIAGGDKDALARSIASEEMVVPDSVPEDRRVEYRQKVAQIKNIRVHRDTLTDSHNSIERMEGIMEEIKKS